MPSGKDLLPPCWEACSRQPTAVEGLPAPGLAFARRPTPSDRQICGYKGWDVFTQCGQPQQAVYTAELPMGTAEAGLWPHRSSVLHPASFPSRLLPTKLQGRFPGNPGAIREASGCPVCHPLQCDCCVGEWVSPSSVTKHFLPETVCTLDDDRRKPALRAGRGVATSLARTFRQARAGWFISLWITGVI